MSELISEWYNSKKKTYHKIWEVKEGYAFVLFFLGDAAACACLHAHDSFLTVAGAVLPAKGEAHRSVREGRRVRGSECEVPLHADIAVAGSWRVPCGLKQTKHLAA